MKKLKMQKVNVHSTKKPAISTFCEGCKELQQEVDVLNAKLNQKVDELQQSNDGLQQSNAELWTAVNSLVVPTYTVHIVHMYIKLRLKTF